MATFFNPINLVIVLLILGTMLALLVFGIRWIVRWVGRPRP